MPRFAPTVLTLAVACWATAAQAQHHTVRFFSTSGKPLAVNDLVFAPDGRRIAISTQDGKTTIVGTAEGEILLQHPLGPFSLAFSPDSSSLLMAHRGALSCSVWRADR